MRWRRKDSSQSGSVRRDASGFDPDAFSSYKLAVAAGPYEPVFYSSSESRRLSFSSRAVPTDSGDHVLLGWISLLGSKAENLTIRFLNRAPARAGCHFSYIIQQGREEEDLRAIEHDLTSGRLFRNGLALQGGAWSRLLLGPRFAIGASRKQVHELTYRRFGCTCLVCLIQRKKFEAQRKCVADADKNKVDANELNGIKTTLKYGVVSQRGSDRITECPHEPVVVSERSYSTPSFKKPKIDVEEFADESTSFLNFDIHNRRETDGPITSNPFANLYPSFAPEFNLKANALQCMRLPEADELEKYLNADVSEGEIQLGTIMRSHARGGIKLKFCDNIRPLLEGLAYSCPLSTQSLSDEISAFATKHSSQVRGKRTRKVFLNGVVIKLPVEVGVAKVPRHSFHLHESGAQFVLYGRQS